MKYLKELQQQIMLKFYSSNCSDLLSNAVCNNEAFVIGAWIELRYCDFRLSEKCYNHLINW